MPNPQISEDYAREIVGLIEQCLTEGFKPKGMPSALMEAGRRLKPSKRLCTYHLDRVKELYGLQPDWTLYRPVKLSPTPQASSAPQVIIKPVYRVGANTSDGRGKISVCAIGDAHDSPTVPKDRFRWIGQHIKERKHDYVVQIGDFASLDSLCKYEANDTLKGRDKPTYQMDMASLKEALGEFNDGLGGYRPEMHVTLGNHEDRVLSFIDRTPEIVGALADTPHTILGDRGWGYSPYGAFHFLGGVGFTHIPWTRMGRPFGGENSENQIGQRTVFDVVKGHDHRRVSKVFPKLNERHVTVISLGCALPDMHIERYAQHSLTGWSYGISDMVIERGHIQKDHWIPMTELEERYG